MALLVPVLLVIALGAAGALTGAAARFVFYAGAAVFVLGVIAKVLGWARSPVPFAIATTCGQQKSLPWIKQDKLENPSTAGGVVARVALEALFFRSLFRNTSTQLRDGKLSYLSNKWLWAAGLAFHWSLLAVLLRHARLFFQPPPAFVAAIARVDGFFQIGMPEVYVSSLLFLGAGAFLLARRLVSAQVRYLSLPADYFALALLLAIGVTGFWMRHVSKIDIPAVKDALIGPPIFCAHLFLVSVLLAYFPFSKLMHAPGLFLSPTRNLKANSREIRHVNPWNHPVPVHTYEEYEDEFRTRMADAGLPVERQP